MLLALKRRFAVRRRLRADRVANAAADAGGSTTTNEIASRRAPTPPSFDCSRAATVVERQICGNPEFSNLDSRIAALLAQALTIVSARDAEALRGDQRAWLKDRDDCGSRGHGNPPAYADVDACLRRELNAREGLLRVVVASRQFTKP